MSRGDKYRAWDGVKMIEVITIDFEKQLVNGHLINPHLVQYTGEHDKANQEIYEGDLLHWKNLLIDDPEIDDQGVVQVVFKYGSWMLERVSGSYLGRWGLWKNIDDQDTENDIAFKVIGNIYSNPELLKEAA